MKSYRGHAFNRQGRRVAVTVPGAPPSVAQLIEDPETSEELRDALRHNVAVRAISPRDTLDEAREKLSARLMVARYLEARR